MYTTATLTIGNFTANLDLTGGPRRHGQHRERINVIGDNGPDYWNRNPAPHFRRNADLELSRLGYRRTAEWTYNTATDQHTAPITPTTDRKENTT